MGLGGASISVAMVMTLEHGRCGQVWLGEAWLGPVQYGRRGLEWQGRVWQVRRGRVECDTARYGRLGEVGLGEVG